MTTGKNSNGEYKSASLILFQDCALSVISSLLAILLIRWLTGPIANFNTDVYIWLSASLGGSLLGILVSSSHRMVRRWVRFRSSFKLVKAIFIKEVVMVLILIFRAVTIPSLESAVLVILADTLLTSIVLFYIRLVAIMFTQEDVDKVKQEAAKLNTLVAGTDARAVAMAEDIMKSDKYNLIGFISPDKSMSGRVIDDIVVYHCQNEEELQTLEWKLGGIDCIMFPKSNVSGTPKSHGKNMVVDPITDKMSQAERNLKRVLDCSLSAILLIIFSPLALISAIAIKLDDGKDILYKQERIGKNGKPFTILKFRTMKMNAEANGAQLFKGDADSRLTKTGKFLRKYHLDELPQLWNVFRGDMSFVGYRPERQFFIDQIMEYNPRYCYLYQMRPGVTSYATLYNGYTDTLEKMLTRLDLDLYYLRNRSLFFDAKVLAKTFLSIVTGRKF